MNTSATLRLRGPCTSAPLSDRVVEGQGKRSVQAIKRLIIKMPLSLYTKVMRQMQHFWTNWIKSIVGYCYEQTTNNKQQTTNNKQQTTNNKQQTTTIFPT